MAPPTPEGIVLLNKYTVGKKIGEGAMCSIHELLLNGKPIDRVTKCAPICDKPFNPKRKPTLVEINASSISAEYNFYNFAGNSLRGVYIPLLGFKECSSIAPIEKDGFRFLILQRMECGLFEGVPKMIRRISSPTIDVSPFAIRLIESVAAVQATARLVVDVKSDNIMFAPDDVKPTRKTLVNDLDALAKRLRLIDFGLNSSWGNASTAGHIANVKGQPVAGTPLYASRHVHGGNTLSRRDDLEAMGLVIAHLVIYIHAKMKDPTKAFSKKMIDQLLPWASAGSDDAIGDVKLDMMADVKSLFYTRMGSKATASIVFKYFEKTHAMKFSEKPKYDELMAILSNLQVSNPNAGASCRQSTSPAATGARVAARGAAGAKESPAKKLKTVAYQSPLAEDTTGRRRSARIASEEVITIDDDDSEDDGDKKPAAKPTKKAPPKAAAAASKTFKAVAFVPNAAAAGGKTKATSAAAAKPASQRKPVPFVGTAKDKSTLKPVPFRATAPRAARSASKAKVDDEDAMDLEYLDGSDDEEEIDLYEGGYSAAAFGKKKKKTGDDDDVSMDVENNADLATANNAAGPMEIDQKFANKKLSVKVTAGAQKGQTVVMSSDYPTLLIGNGRVKSKPKEPMLALSMDDKIQDTHCKLVFGTTEHGTQRVTVTAYFGGVVVNNSELKVGKPTKCLRGTGMTIGNTPLYFG